MSERLVAEIVHIHIKRGWIVDTERWYPEDNRWCYMDKLVEVLEELQKTLGPDDRLDIRIRLESAAWKEYNALPHKEMCIR